MFHGTRRWAPATLAVAAGALLITGALLPWLTMMAGLHRYAGIIGVNGQVVAAGGALAILAGLALVRPGPRMVRLLPPALAVGGLALFAFTLHLLAGLLETVRQLADNPLLVARPGHGLYVAAAGAALLTLAPLAAWWRGPAGSADRSTWTAPPG